MKKLLFSLVALATVLSMLAGCATPAVTQTSAPAATSAAAATTAADAATTAPAQASAAAGGVSEKGMLPIVSAPIKLKFFHEATMTDSEIADLSKNNVLKYIETTTGIHLDFTIINATDGKQKMQLAFASGDYPDGGLLDWNTNMTRDDIVKYGTGEKLLLPLNQYIDKYAFELQKIFDERPTIKGAITAPDGNIYGLPRFSECQHCMSYPKMWVNYDWIKKLGIKEPTTTDEFEAMLKAFKTGDPNGNGKADEIALTACTQWSCPVQNYLMNSFIYLQANAATTNLVNYISLDASGKPEFVADKPEFKAGLQWMKKLYDEGLIDPAAFTQTTDGLAQQCRSGGDTATVGAYTCDHMGMGIDFANKTINAQYHALPPVAGPNGVRYQPYTDLVSQINGFQFVLFDKCSNPAAAFRLADWMLGEDVLPIFAYGLEGYGWKKPDDPNAKNVNGGQYKWQILPLPQDATQEQKDTLRLNSFWTGFFGDLSERRAEWMPAATDATLLSDYETRLDIETQRTSAYWPKQSAPRSLFMNADDSDKYTEELTNINTAVMKNMSMFITGARSFNEWDAYVNELKQYNVDDYLALYTKAYNSFASSNAK